MNPVRDIIQRSQSTKGTIVPDTMGDLIMFMMRLLSPE